MLISKSGLINAIDTYRKRVDQCNLLIASGKAEIVCIQADIQLREKDIEDSTHILSVLNEQLETRYPEFAEN